MARIFEARRVEEDGKSVLRSVPVEPQPAPKPRAEAVSRWRVVVSAPWRWLVGLWRRVDMVDLHLYPGIALVTYGCWLMWSPLGYVVAGAALVWLAVRPVEVEDEDG